MSAITDPKKIKKDDPANPDVCMVYYYHRLIDNNVQTVCDECKKGERGCVACKKELSKALFDYLKPMQERRKYYEEHMDEVELILKNGTEAARERAKKVMYRVRKNMKLDYFDDK